MPKKRHVFLFRHCVRSVKEKINFHEESTNSNSDDGNDHGKTSDVTQKYQDEEELQIDKKQMKYSQNPLDYISEKPNWNTPELWCTSQGARIMKEVGADILLKYLVNNNEISNNVTSSTFTTLSSPSHHIARLSLNFIADKSPRDVQTAYAMMEGMAQVVKDHLDHYISAHGSKNCIIIKGLDTIEIEPRLFNPTERNGFREYQSTLGAIKHDLNNKQLPICQKPSVLDKANDIEQRYRKMPPPLNFTDTLLWIEANGGKRFMEYFRNYEQLKTPFLPKNATDFQGAFNLVKYVAETLFYTFASNISFWGNQTSIGDIYQMASWIHWSRYVLNIGNNEAAANGGVIMARILHILQDRHNHDDDIHATFIIGHDGNLDALATALGISWNLPSPYLPGYAPTPPGSALHFSYDGNEVEISFLAPIFLNPKDHYLNPTTNTTTTTKNYIYKEVPVSFSALNATIRDQVTVLPSIQLLQSRTLDVMGQYSGALECFHAAEKVWHKTDSHQAKPFTNETALFVVSLSCIILVVSAICFYILRVGKRRQGVVPGVMLMNQMWKYQDLNTQRLSPITATSSSSELV